MIIYTSIDTLRLLSIKILMALLFDVYIAIVSNYVLINNNNYEMRFKKIHLTVLMYLNEKKSVFN